MSPGVSAGYVAGAARWQPYPGCYRGILALPGRDPAWSCCHTHADAGIAAACARTSAVVMGWALHDPCQDLTDVRWAPYQEFGIPDPAEQSDEPPAGPVVICATGYQREQGAERIVIYWSRDGRRPAFRPPAAERDLVFGWLGSAEASRHNNHWVALNPETGEFLGRADDLPDLRRWRAADALIVFVDLPSNADPPYSQEQLDAAAAEIARQQHGGPADPEDIQLASEVLTAAFTVGMRQQVTD